jgi:hypothetical protein
LTSDRKVQANRANARRSTGAKTRDGRVRSAKNAFRHGLSLPVDRDPDWSDKVETLAQHISGLGADGECLRLARRIADAQVDLCRARYARHQLLSQALSNPYYESRAATRATISVLHRLLGKSGLDALITDEMERFLTATPQGPMKLATIVLQEAKKLLAMNRYERRALSRRKFAIRAFDAARKMP